MLTRANRGEGPLGRKKSPKQRTQPLPGPEYTHGRDNDTHKEEHKRDAGTEFQERALGVVKHVLL